MTAYTVMPGDTMWGIANKFEIKISDLMAANPQITNSNLIFSGQIINIPGNNASTYTVIPGDTMWRIATKYGITVNELMAANPQITNSNLIFSGQIINIPAVADVPSPADNIKALETEVIRLVNVERARTGQSALVENNKINNVARIKSKDFINNNYFAHNSPIYGTPFDMIRSFGITFTAAAENIARGHRTAAEVMNSWMSSSSHRANILNSTYNQIGVGVAKDDSGNLFWTQIFIKN